MRRRDRLIMHGTVCRNPHVTAVKKIEDCVSVRHPWFAHSGVALNPDKSEAIWPPTTSRAKSLSSLIDVGAAGATVRLSKAVEASRRHRRCQLQLDQPRQEHMPAAFFHIRTLRYIRSSLSEEMVNSVACSRAQSRLECRPLTAVERVRSAIDRAVTLSGSDHR